MSIQSTLNVTRHMAIKRIKRIHMLASNNEYLILEAETCESDSIPNSIAALVDVNIDHIDKWTNKMLEDVLDRPFFRMSMFDNYHIQ